MFMPRFSSNGFFWFRFVLLLLSTAVISSAEQTATPVSRLSVKTGFKVELLYSVPKEQQGSWVSMCVDHKGRIIVSDQYGGLYRITPSDPGKQVEASAVENLKVDMGHAQGLLYAFDSLYVVINGKEHGGRGFID